MHMFIRERRGRKSSAEVTYGVGVWLSFRPKMVIRSCDVGVSGSFHPNSDFLKQHIGQHMSADARSTDI